MPAKKVKSSLPPPSSSSAPAPPPSSSSSDAPAAKKKDLKKKKKVSPRVKARKTAKSLIKKCRPFTPFKKHTKLRAQRNQYEQYARLRIEGVTKKAELPFYLGKRVGFFYRAHRKISNSLKKNKEARVKKEIETRVIWGKIVKSHGGSGVVLSRFRKNLPSNAIGSTVRVFMYPSNI